MTNIKKKYKVKYKNILKLLIILLIPIVVLNMYKSINTNNKTNKKNNNNKIEKKIKTKETFKLDYSKSVEIPNNILEIVNNSDPSIIISDENGKVLASRKEHDRREGASTTKVFVGYAALNLLDLEKDKIIGTQYSLDECNPYCRNNIEVGSELNVIDAATYVFPDSANSVATDISIAIGKKYYNVSNDQEAEQKGLEKINEFIKAKGCTNTHLGNANGLNTTPTDNDNNFDINTGYPKENCIDGISANDLALITTLAMKDKNFRDGINNNDKLLYIKAGKGFFCHGVWQFNYKNKLYYISLLGINCNKGDDKNKLINELYNWAIKELI